MRFSPPFTVGPLTPAQVESVSALAAEVAAFDGAAPLSEHFLLQLSSQATDITHVLAHSKQGAVVGYAQVNRQQPIAVAELFVSPADRRRGVGSILLKTVQRDVSLPLSGGSGPTANQPLRIWAHGNLPGAHEFAQHHGLKPVRELLQMTTALAEPAEEPPAAPAAPATEPSESATFCPDSPEATTFTFRAFRPGQDDEDWLAANAQAFAWHPEQGAITAVDLQQRLGQPWFDPNGLVLAVAQHPAKTETIAGFVWTKIDDPDAGEIYALGVVPQHQHCGLGAKLLRRGLEHLATRVPRARLYVEAGNQAAVALYEKANFRVTCSDIQYARAE